MTQEEKARAYDEALERARKQRDEYQEELDKTDKDSKLASILRAAISAIELAFPELSESEDERIMKALIEVFKKKLERGFEWVEYGIPNRSVLDWLEKQKENSEYVFRPLAGTDITIAAEQAIRKAKEGDRLVLAFNGFYTPVFKHDSVKRIVDEYDSFIEKPKEQSEEPKIVFGDWGNKEKREAIITCLKYMRFVKKITNQEYDDLTKWLDNNYVKVEQKPAEWSEKYIADVFEKVGLAKIVREQGNDGLTNALQATMIELSKVRTTEWNEEDKEMLGKVLECIRFAEDHYQLEEEGTNGISVKLWLIDHIIPQPKQEWSEEDKKMCNNILNVLTPYLVYDGTYTRTTFGKKYKYGSEIRWIKSLPERFNIQPKQEWSDEEKEILDNILSHYVLIDKPTDANGIPKEKYISLIKSLRFDTYKNCNSHYKPSEEQMEALLNTLHPDDPYYHDLKSLYEQLK